MTEAIDPIQDFVPRTRDSRDGADRGGEAARAAGGAPRTGDARRLWWDQEASSAGSGESLRSRALPDALVDVTVREVLDYFEKCPRCGYPAQASATVRTYRSGRVESVLQPTCGLPCGWRGVPS